MRQTIYPAVRYGNADAALEFLVAAFGATAREVYRNDAGAIHHGEIVIGDAMICRPETAEAPAPSWQDEMVRSSHRLIRYGAPVATVIVGVLFAAVETNSLGNTVSLVLIGGGLIWFMTTLGREMGMTATTGRAPRVPRLPPDEDEPGADDGDR
jgi:hypothetical protein